MFSDGEAALLVHTPLWKRARSYRAVKIGKVHKTGRLTLEGGRGQWKVGHIYSGPEYFVAVSAQTSGSGRLYKDSPELRSEIDAEQAMQSKRFSLQKIGEAMTRIRDDEEGAGLYDLLPEELKRLAEN